MSDVHAEHAPEALVDPTDPWGTLGAHVVAAKGARAARRRGCKRPLERKLHSTVELQFATPAV
eukprot:scaffold74171_cov69-Phaeocystis_antarctica.AAC.2